LPELSLNASGGLSGTGFNFSESYQRISSHPGTYWAAGMQFSVPLGNTTLRNEHIKSKVRAEQAQDQIRALTWRIRNDIEYDMRSLISARLQIQLADKSSQFAEQRLEEYRKNNLLKTASIQDVLNAENDLNVTRNAQLEAVETFSNAVVKLWKDTGLLLDRHGVHIDTSRPASNVENRESNLSLLLDPSADAGQESGTAAELVPEPFPSSRDAAPDSADKTSAASVVTTPAKAAQTGISADTMSYTLYFGEYSSQSVIADSIAKIKSVGLVPQIKQGPQKTEQIFRLYMTDYPNLLQAQKALKKLQQHKAGGFILMNEKKRHAVYAGSFTDQNAATAEQARLAGHGIKVRPEKATRSSQTSLLSAGNFQGREAPLEYARKLELMGLKSVLTEKP
jgi:cell division protein FtsN